MEWDEYLYGFAEHAARKSKDATKVGAVLVAPNGRSVLLTAFNGPAPGVRDLPDRRERPRKYLFANHAERNLIATAAYHGIRTQNTSVYCTHRCCSACAGEMIAAGVSRFTYGPGRFGGDNEQWDAASDMLREAGVSYGAAFIEVSGEPRRWSFDDYAIGRLSESGSTIESREILKPEDMALRTWYVFAGRMIENLNKAEGRR
jgi:dCMP deaminase